MFRAGADSTGKPGRHATMLIVTFEEGGSVDNVDCFRYCPRGKRRGDSHTYMFQLR